jgi:hypothetical protein
MFEILFISYGQSKSRGVRRGVSKGVEDSHRPQAALRVVHPFLVFRVGASHDQAGAQMGEKSTFQAIHLQFFVIYIVSISLGKPKTGFGIS